MKDNGFACPVCAEPTGVNVVTVDCGADHALCPVCAEKWFSSCSRCHMCNESIESIHVHLLSSVVEEVEPAEMARSIEDRSIYKAVFSVLAQTKLKPETMDEEELRAWLPTDLCQACHADCGRNPLRCSSCGDPYHLRCTGLRRRPRVEWCCLACDGVNVAIPDVEFVETERHQAREPSHVSGVDAAGRATRSTSAGRQATENEEFPAPLCDAVPHLQHSSRAPSSSAVDVQGHTGSLGSMKHARKRRSSFPAIHMGWLAENRMQSAVSSLLALQCRPAEVEPGKQRRPRMRQRSCFHTSTAAGPKEFVDGAGSSDSIQALPHCVGASTFNQATHSAVPPTCHVRATGRRHAARASASAAAQSQTRVPLTAVESVTAHPSQRTNTAAVQGHWVPQANPCKRKVFVPHPNPGQASDGSQTSVTSQQMAVSASERSRRQPEPHSGGRTTPMCGNSVTAVCGAYARASVNAHSYDSNVSCSRFDNVWPTGRNMYKRPAMTQDADDQVAPCRKLVRGQHSVTSHQGHDERQKESGYASQHSSGGAPCASVPASVRSDLIIQTDTTSACTAPLATKKVTSFSRKLMRKAFHHYAFQDALPESELIASADHAAELLSATIANALHPIGQGDAHRFVQGVIDRYDILFANEKAHNGVVKYLRNEVIKFSRTALAH